jgi:hypothetical protein
VRTAIRRLASFALLAVLMGCAIQVDMPTDFLVTHETSYQFKATTADGAIFIVEKYDLPKKGDNLAFWVDAIQNHFEENLGYEPIEEQAIETNSGEKAVQMIFEATTGGRTYRYLLTVCIQPGPIACVARFTAEKQNFDQHVDAVKKAMLTIRT